MKTDKKYDYLIIGGGPSGILCAYNLAVNNKDKKILIIEQNKKTIDDYNDKYGEVENKNTINLWYNAQLDTDYQYTFNSEDNKLVWMGKGLGGGTNVFGLQYIDQSEIINKNYGENEWSYKNWESEFNEVRNIIQPEKYNYEINGPNPSWDEFYEVFNDIKSDNVILHNNYLYGKNLIDIDNSKRLILGNLLEDFTNIDILYDVRIKKLVIENNEVKYAECFSNNLYYGNQVILTSGAVQTPAILQRSCIGNAETCLN